MKLITLVAVKKRCTVTCRIYQINVEILLSFTLRVMVGTLSWLKRQSVTYLTITAYRRFSSLKSDHEDERKRSQFDVEACPHIVHVRRIGARVNLV